MGSEARGPPTTERSLGLGAGRESAITGPVAVVWCRQVDNEAESPGYTTVPEEFPGRRETLELIRLVGNLTINVADTHDYWTPGPPQPLSYYPNLFLYPAFGGRYTCIGRMFLSTEDRPRLGMKTLVLDTSQLLASGEYGASVMRWWQTMAGSRADQRRPPVPDPALYALLGEGLLFFRGSTEPLVAVASNEWDAAMETVFDLVRVLPASLLTLGAILAFPYFLPQPKTDLHEFTEQVPLALSLMRIPMAEAMGDRHKKRIQSWESTSVTFRDLTNGLPAPGKGKDPVPLVLQLARDHNAARLGPIVQRVDLVELPKLRALYSDSERQSGKERRKEMWRIGTAMESAALLLQRGRGRHVPVSVETAKRAQEYIRAQLPAPDGESADVPAVVNPSEPGVGTPAPVGAAPPAPVALPEPPPRSGGVPSWLSRGADAHAATPKGPESVPISLSDDPSLLAGRPPPRPTAPPVLTLDTATIDRQVDEAIARALPARLAQVEEDILKRLAGEIEQAVGGEVDRRMESTAETKLRGLLSASETKFAQTLTALDTRWQDRLRAAVTAGAGSPPEEWRRAIEASIDERIARAADGARAELAGAVRDVLAKLGELETRNNTQVTGLLAGTESRLRESLPSAVAPEVDRRVRSALERELADGPKGDKGMIAARIDARVDETIRLQMQGAGGQFERALQELEGRIGERLRATQLAGAPLTGRALESVQPLIDRRVVEVSEAQRTALEEFQREARAREEAEHAALALQADERLRDALAGEADARTETEARLRTWAEGRSVESEQRRPKELRELETRVSALIETRTKEMQARLGTIGKEVDTRIRASTEERARELETRFGQTLEGRLAEAREAQAHTDADLQVRLQSYSDQKLREAEEHLRGTTVDLMARLRSEVETSLGRVPDTARIDAAVKERLQRANESVRAELELTLDHRLNEAEDRLQHTAADAVQKLGSVERDLQEHTKDLAKIEESVRAELDDVDRRLVTLSDRLLPVVRKTWLRITELERTGPGAAPADLEPRLSALRRELKDDLRRMDAELTERTRDIRDRMETTIAHQGKVWLTLIHQLSQLTEDRRQNASVPFPPLAAGPVVSPDEEEPDASEEEEEPEEPPPSRRRQLRSRRGVL